MSTPSLFYRAIEHVLRNWTALQMCVKQGSGGRESAAKAEWLIGATEQWLCENSGVHPEELTEFYQDVFWTEFDTEVDDGSLSLVAKTIINFEAKIERGLGAEVEAVIRDAPRVVLQVVVAPNDDDHSATAAVDDEEDGGEEASSATHEALCTRCEGEGEDMEVDEAPKPEDDDEEDGWTTVKKAGKR